jgi:hypothetical protein
MFGNRFYSLKALFFVFCLCLLTTANKCTPKPHCDALPQTAAEDAVPAPKNNLETDIYLDATLSMQGFTTTDGFSYYQKTIPILERAAKAEGTEKSVNFFKFGTIFIPLEGRTYADAANKNFYLDEKTNLYTYINNILNNANPEHLTVIVTDLYQDKADINQITDQITNKYIGNKLAVGVMGVKSQFNGSIFDVGINNRSFKYVNKSEVETYRPFYILALGSFASINQYFDSLEKFGLSEFPIKQRLIFSRYLLEKPPSFNDAYLSEKSSTLNEVTDQGSLVNYSQENTQIKEFKIKAKAETASFITEIPIKPLKSDISFGKSLTTDVKTYTCSNSENKSVPPAFNGDANLDKALKVEANLASASELQLKVGVQPDKLQADAVNCFQITVYPANYTLPDWTAQWNMSDEQVELWWKAKKEDFDGSKTYNLTPFLVTLWEVVKKEQKPKLGDFYCYFKRS